MIWDRPFNEVSRKEILRLILFDRHSSHLRHFATQIATAVALYVDDQNEGNDPVDLRWVVCFNLGYRLRCAFCGEMAHRLFCHECEFKSLYVRGSKEDIDPAARQVRMLAKGIMNNGVTPWRNAKKISAQDAIGGHCHPDRGRDFYHQRQIDRQDRLDYYRRKVRRKRQWSSLLKKNIAAIDTWKLTKKKAHWAKKIAYRVSEIEAQSILDGYDVFSSIKEYPSCYINGQCKDRRIIIGEFLDLGIVEVVRGRTFIREYPLPANTTAPGLA